MLVFIDYETYYDPASGYTLKKMTPAEYILDPRWQVHGMAAKFVTPGSSVLGGHVEWFDAAELPGVFAWLRTQHVTVVTYNALFDMCITAWRYGYIPSMMIDVLGMVRALYGPVLVSKSLGIVAQFLKLPAGGKGTAIHQVAGLRTAQIKAIPELWQQFVDYSKQDINLTVGAFEHTQKLFPTSELLMMDLVLRTTVDPMFRFNVPLLESHLEDLKQQKSALLDAAGLQYDADGRVPELMSAAKFKVLLEGLGVVVEEKISPTTGRSLPALAKTDDFMQGLLEDPDPMVATLAAARLGHKSTLEETRTQRLITMARLSGGFWTPGAAPMPLRYGAAHTHRLGGDWKINCQNFPSGRAGQTNKLRQAIEVDADHVIMTADMAQIEARLSGWLAGEKTLLQEFANDLDPYGRMGALIFDIPYEQGFRKRFVVEGFVGKTCVAAGTQVYTQRGLVAIESVQLGDKVWDGERWVCHSGVVCNGSRITLPICGVWLTPDHLVWSGTQWWEAELLGRDGVILSQALEHAAASWLSRDISKATVGGLNPLSLSATAGAPNTLWTAAILKTLRALGATFVQNLQRHINGTGNMQRLCPTTGIEHDYSTDSPLPLPAAIPRLARFSNIMGVGALGFTCLGGSTVQSFSSTFKRYRDGTTRLLKWIGRTIAPAMSPETLGLCRGKPMSTIDESSKTLKRKLAVYDLCSAGPHNRFMVHTDRGPLIVHNCILGLGYQAGPARFWRMVHAGAKTQLGKDIPFTMDEATASVVAYRMRYSAMQNMWRYLGSEGLAALTGNGLPLDVGPFHFSHNGNVGQGEITGPGGLKMVYPDLQNDEAGEWTYRMGKKRSKIYGGKILENITQFGARIIVMDAALRLYTKHGIRMGLQAHDELVFKVRKDDVERTKALVLTEMTRVPAWATGLPLKAEVGVGANYGAAKG